MDKLKSQSPVLLEKFPDLKDGLQWIPLGNFPTPVHRLKGLGHSNLWIKRDDKSSMLYGGNKVRKLEFTLAHALSKKKSRVITMGGIGTNHGLATAVYCKQLNLSCRLLLFKQPVTSYVKENLLLFGRHNAELIYTGNPVKTIMHFYLFQRIINPGAYFLYAGGSSPYGTLGFVNAAFELKRQIENNTLPEPEYIFCPLGSNGTMAGLALGLLLAGIKSRVIGINVIPSHFGPLQLATPGKVKSLMNKTYSLLKKNSKMIPEIEITEPCVYNDYSGTGYGQPTGECRSAIKIMRDQEGIKLEPSYTAKTCAALLDFIQKPDNSGRPILYWHTYNSSRISDLVTDMDYHALPKKLHKFFQEKELTL